MEKTRSRKGFFFTIMALAILSFILLSVSVWVRSFEQSDERLSQKFRGQSMRLVLSAISDESLSEFANASAFYATYRLANYTSIYGLAASPARDGSNPNTGRVEQALAALVINGTARPDDAGGDINYTPEEKDGYILLAWQSKISQAASAMGFNATFSEPRDLVIRQLDPWTVGISFAMDMNISDFEGTMRQQKTLHANSNFSISGFYDPFVSRNDRYQRCAGGLGCVPITKQIFKHARYGSVEDVKPKKINDALEGNGWFFGPAIYEYPDRLNATVIGRLSQYALVHKYDENLTNYAQWYGAVILTTPPGSNNSLYDSGNCQFNVTEQTGCLNCIRSYKFIGGLSECPDFTETFNTIPNPLLVTDGTSWLSDIATVSRDGIDDEKYILFNNEYDAAESKRQGYHEIYEITPLRDMTVCGFYVKGGRGPSFFQRMLAVPAGDPSVNNERLGIETIVAGQWAGGKLDQLHDEKSRVDFEFYSEPPLDPVRLDKIKGMPGCKSKDMCSSDEATTDGIGKFRMGIESWDLYGLSGLTCENSQPSSSCG